MKCHDWNDNPECLGDIDESFTMNFDDIGHAPIYWCSHCGREAHQIAKAIEGMTDKKKKELSAELDRIDNAKRVLH